MHARPEAGPAARHVLRRARRLGVPHGARAGGGAAAGPLRCLRGHEALWLPAAEVDRLDLHPGFADELAAAARGAGAGHCLRRRHRQLGNATSGRPRRGPCRCRRRLYTHLSGLASSGIAAPPEGIPGPLLARWYPDYILVLDEAAAAAAAESAAADEALAASEAPRYSWNAPLAVRTAEIRIVAVTHGAQAGDVIADLAGVTPGQRLVISASRPIRFTKQALRMSAMTALMGCGSPSWQRRCSSSPAPTSWSPPASRGSSGHSPRRTAAPPTTWTPGWARSATSSPGRTRRRGRSTSSPTAPTRA